MTDSNPIDGQDTPVTTDPQGNIDGATSNDGVSFETPDTNPVDTLPVPPQPHVNVVVSFARQDANTPMPTTTYIGN